MKKPSVSNNPPTAPVEPKAAVMVVALAAAIAGLAGVAYSRSLSGLEHRVLAAGNQTYSYNVSSCPGAYMKSSPRFTALIYLAQDTLFLPFKKAKPGSWDS